MGLNDAAHAIADEIVARAADLGVNVARTAGVRVVDCGVHVGGTPEAGLLMARAAMAGLGTVDLRPATDRAFAAEWPDCPWPVVAEASRETVAACLAAQCAGWRVESPGFVAMASGPVRAAIGREAVYDAIGKRERPVVAVGLLEADRLPPAEACLRMAADAGVRPEALTVLVARTASVAGCVQVTSRALETAVHKLHALGFDLDRIRGGRGVAPLPPVPAGNDLSAIGRTNDAILYGGRVVLEVSGPEADLEALGPRAVSLASPAYGRPFLDLFESAGRDFYSLDPALFAPARLDLLSLESNRVLRFGRLDPDLVGSSFCR